MKQLIMRFLHLNTCSWPENVFYAFFTILCILYYCYPKNGKKQMKKRKAVRDRNARLQQYRLINFSSPYHPIDDLEIYTRCRRPLLSEVDMYDLKQRFEYEKKYFSVKGNVNISRSYDPSEFKGIIHDFFRQRLNEEYTIFIYMDCEVLDEYDMLKGRNCPVLLTLRCDRDYRAVCDYLVKNNNMIEINDDIQIHIVDFD
eukprot:UN11543